MGPRDHAALLMRKAAQDQFAVEKLISDPAAPDEIIGFHAQQAAEKFLKAVLAAKSIEYRLTHDLAELIDLLRANSVPFPQELDDLRRLTPFAAAFRYDDLPDEPEQPFDRPWVQSRVKSVLAWALSAI